MGGKWKKAGQFGGIQAKENEKQNEYEQ